MSRKRTKPKADSPLTGDYSKKPDRTGFDWFRGIGVSLIAAVAFSVATFNGFDEMWKKPSSPMILAAQLVLLSVLIVLDIRWIIATHLQLEMWIRWLNHHYPKPQVYAAMIILSIVLGVMPAFSHRIVIISGIMNLYFFVNYWTQWLSNDHFKSALQENRTKPMSKVKDKALVAMESFWLRRPQLARITTTQFFSGIAFSLALAGAYQQEPGKRLFQLSAYFLLIVDVLISEIVMAWWRFRLEQAITKAERNEN
jgi:hypothetical protein